MVDAYLTYVAGGEEALLARDSPAARATPASEEPAAVHGYREGRWGSREVEITSVRLLDDRGRVRHVYVPGESLTLSLGVRAAQEVRDFVFGVGLFTADGVQVYGTNTHLEEYVPRMAAGLGQVKLTLRDLRLVEGTYLVDVAAHRRDGTPYDYLRGLHSFRVKSRVKDVGVYRPPHDWAFAGGVDLAPPTPRPELDLREVEPAATPLSALLEERAAWKDAGRKVVLTNGCFDLLHPGPVSRPRARRATSWSWPSTPTGPCARSRETPAPSSPRPSGPRSCAPCRRWTAWWSTTSPRRSASLPRSSPTSWSRARTGPWTPSWDAKRSSVPADAWCVWSS